MVLLAIIALLCGYLLGSFPSAVVVARLWGKKDMIVEGDGHLGAAAAYRTLGRVPFVLVVLLDGLKGILAVYLAYRLTGSTAVVAGAAYAAVIGHCWSVFIGFKGGLGAVVTYGVLLAAVTEAFLLGAAVAAPVLLLTRRSTLSTYVLLATASIVLWIQDREKILILLPLALIIIPQIKRIQAHKSDEIMAYKNDLLHDLKRQQ